MDAEEDAQLAPPTEPTSPEETDEPEPVDAPQLEDPEAEPEPPEEPHERELAEDTFEEVEVDVEVPEEPAVEDEPPRQLAGSRVELRKLPTDLKQGAKSREVLQCALQVQDAADLLEGKDPDALPRERVQRLVREVEGLLARLARLDSGAPEAVKAHNALATQLVRYRRRLAAPEPEEAGGFLDRIWKR